MNFYDAHNHLHDAWLVPHRPQIFTDLAQIPLRAAVVNGTCESDWPEVAALCASNSQPSTLNSQLQLLPSFGLHPWHVGNATPQWRDHLLAHLDSHQSHPTPPSHSSHSSLPAIGEIGLDRWILDRAHPDDSRLTGLRRASFDEQRAAFTWQLTLAAERNLPVTIHCIDAWGALLETLRASPRPARGFLLHAYASSAELARDFAALGAYFSFNGSWIAPAQTAATRDTDRSARRRAVFRHLPADRLLVETDAPAMPPPPNAHAYSLPGLADGSPLNHPANIGAIYAGLAVIRGSSIESLAAQVEQNFKTLFES